MWYQKASHSFKFQPLLSWLCILWSMMRRDRESTHMLCGFHLLRSCYHDSQKWQKRKPVVDKIRRLNSREDVDFYFVRKVALLLLIMRKVAPKHFYQSVIVMKGRISCYARTTVRDQQSFKSYFCNIPCQSLYSFSPNAGPRDRSKMIILDLTESIMKSFRPFSGGFNWWR